MQCGESYLKCLQNLQIGQLKQRTKQTGQFTIDDLLFAWRHVRGTPFKIQSVKSHKRIISPGPPQHRNLVIY